MYPCSLSISLPPLYMGSLSYAWGSHTYVCINFEHFCFLICLISIWLLHQSEKPCQTLTTIWIHNLWGNMEKECWKEARICCLVAGTHSIQTQHTKHSGSHQRPEGHQFPDPVFSFARNDHNRNWNQQRLTNDPDSRFPVLSPVSLMIWPSSPDSAP